VQLILDFTRHFKLYQLDVDEAASSPLFVNSAINRACELSQSLSLFGGVTRAVLMPVAMSVVMSGVQDDWRLSTFEASSTI
jgi:hypothetical protein